MSSDLVCIETFNHRRDVAATSPHLMLAAGGARLLVRAEDAKLATEYLDADPVLMTGEE